ncbi:hypothetical protein BC629DRAFT_1595122 [Irpex lacteus]|nr:hypothetical protein BC629DRAFT_1595122 [Irpex lacteus]
MSIICPSPELIGGLRPTKTLEYETSAPIKPFLKGSDAVLSEVSESLGLQASIWVAYQSDDNYAAILCNRRVAMPDYEIESGAWLLIKQHGGMRVQNTRNSPHGLLVHWATKTDVPQSPFREGYIVHGNEACLVYMYGRLCLLIRLGPRGGRENIPIVADEDEPFEY